MVDDADYKILAQKKWYAAQLNKGKYKYGSGGWYAVRHDRSDGPMILMHREVAKLAGMAESKRYDHKDGNGLNNQRQNIRPASQLENGRNRGTALWPGKSSRFKGVSLFKRTRRWMAHIRINGKLCHLGTFSTEEEAAKAYDRSARLHFGEFARTNFPIATPGTGWTRHEPHTPRFATKKNALRFLRLFRERQGQRRCGAPFAAPCC